MSGADSIGNLFIEIQASMDRLNGQIKQIEGKIVKDAKSIGEKAGRQMSESMKAGLAQVRNVSAVAFGALSIGLGQSIKNASNLGESLNAVNVVFKDGSDIIHKFGETSASAVGLSTRAFNEMATKTGALLSQTGQDVDAIADSTIELSKRASDMASVFNTDVEQAMDAINQALRGETEAIRNYGVIISDTAIKEHARKEGLVATGKELSEQEKVLARYSLIMKQSAVTAGDFANTSDALANRQRVVAAKMENLSATIGKGFLPVMETIVGVVDNVVGKLASRSEENPELAKNIAIASIAITGLVAGASALALSVGPLTTAFTVLTGPIGLVIAGITALGVAWATNFGGLRDITNQIFGSVGKTLGNIAKSIKKSLGLDTAAGVDKFKQKIVDMSKKVEDALKKAQKFFADFVKGIKKRLGLDTEEGIKKFEERMAKMREVIGDVMNGLKTVISGIRQAIQYAFGQILAKGKELFSFFGELFGGGGEGDPINRSEKWEQTKEILSKVRQSLGAIAKTAFDAVTSVIQGVMVVIGGIIKTFSALFQGDWKGAWEAVKATTAKLGEIVKGLFGKLFDNIVAIFEPRAENLKAGWEAIKDNIVNAVTTLRRKAYNMFARMANGIIDVLNRLIEQANKVPGVAINTIDKLNLKLEEETENAKQRGKDVVSNLASGMKSTLYKVRSVLGESVNALVKAMELMKKGRYEDAQNIIKRVAEGLADTQHEVDAQIDQVKQTVASIEDSKHSAGTRGSNIVQAFVSGMSGKLPSLDAVTSQIKSKVNSALSYLQKAGSASRAKASAFAGGTLIPNRPTLVGEHGPEIVIPSGRASVMPNHTINKTITINNGDFTTNTTPDRFASELERALGNIRL